MITAKQAREIFENAQIETAKEVWEEIKEGLYEAIEINAKSRCEGLTFGVHDDISQFKRHGGSWIEVEYIRNKVMYELRSKPLEFDVIYDNELNQMTINW